MFNTFLSKGYTKILYGYIYELFTKTKKETKFDAIPSKNIPDVTMKVN